MSKVGLAEQIEAVALLVDNAEMLGLEDARDTLAATLATLCLFQKYESEVRDFLSLCIKRDEELPGAKIEVHNG